MFGLFVLFPPRRYIWETFCNFWHFSGHIFFFFQTVGDLFLFGSAGGWGRCGAPERFVSPALPGEGAGGRGEGGARSDLLYLFLFSASKVTAD